MLGLELGVQSLLAYRLALSTSANNIANANTPGYSRQRVVFSPNSTFNVGQGLQIGTGVQALNIERITDEFLNTRVRVAQQSLGRLDIQTRKIRTLENVFNDLGGAGLQDLIGGFFNSVRGLSASPSDLSLRTATLESGTSLTTGFKGISNRVSSIERDLLTELRGPVDDINTHLATLHELNLSVASVELNGGTASGLRDQRSAILTDLGRLVDIDVIERDLGKIDVLVGGRLVVHRSGFVPLQAGLSDDGNLEISARGSSVPLSIRDGQLAGLLEFGEGILKKTRSDLDDLARNLIFEVNRQHSTGIPLGGGFRTLASEYRPEDADGSGSAADDLLSEANLDFPVTAGSLYVSVADDETGTFTRTKIDIDPTTQSLEDVASALSSIDNISATADSTGRLFIRSEPGFRFDFSTRTDPNPDPSRSLGGSAATLSSANSFPASLSVGDAFDLSVDGGSAQTITISGADFADPGNATAEELALVINRDSVGVTATVESNRLVIRSDTDGSSSTLLLTDVSGSPSSALGLSTATETGSDQAVTVTAEGLFSGNRNDEFTFTASSSGRIGETDGLQIEVRNQAGDLISVLDVGSDYTPGTNLNVAQGIAVSFGPGEISSTSGDFFNLEVLADSDTSNILASLGLNNFFSGTDAKTIELSNQVLDNPAAIAASLNGNSGDGSNLLRLLDLEGTSIEGLSGFTFEGFYGTVSSRIGFEGRRTDQLFTTQETLHQLLRQERDQVSGVSIDEETLNLVQFQQTFEALTRYVQAVNETTDQLLTILN